MFIERLKIMLIGVITTAILAGLWLLGGEDLSFVKYIAVIMILVYAFWAINAEPEDDSSED